jgi:hypothetical protein
MRTLSKNLPNHNNNHSLSLKANTSVHTTKEIVFFYSNKVTSRHHAAKFFILVNYAMTKNTSIRKDVKWKEWSSKKYKM